MVVRETPAASASSRSLGRRVLSGTRSGEDRGAQRVGERDVRRTGALPCAQHGVQPPAADPAVRWQVVDRHGATMPEVAMSSEATTGPELLSMEMWLWLGISRRPARGTRRARCGARVRQRRAGAPAPAGVALRLVRAAISSCSRERRRRAHVCSRGAALDASRCTPRAPGRAAAGRPRPVRGVDRDARGRRPGQHAVGRAHAGDRAAHGSVLRRRDPADRAGRPGVLDPAAAAPRRRDRRERRRDQRARRPVPRAARRAARRDRRARSRSPPAASCSTASRRACTSVRGSGPVRATGS